MRDRPFSFIEINKIHHKNCMELIEEIPDEFLDAIITDFPYGIDFQSNFRKKSPKLEKIDNDKQPYIEWIEPSFFKLKDCGSLTCFYRFDVQDILFEEIKRAGFIIKSQLVWHKGGTGMGDLEAQFAPQHELMVFAIKGKYNFPNGRPSSVYKINKIDGNSMIHPNEKPVNLFRALVRDITVKGEIVADFFSGSGACAVACKEEGRDFIACDTGERYVNLGNKRISKTVESINVFL